MAVVFAAEKAPEAGDQPHHLAQRWRGFGRWGAMGHDPGGLPFLGIEQHVTGQIRAIPAPRDQVQDAPGDDQVKDQGPFQPRQGAQLQRFHPAARFPNAEKISTRQRRRYQSISSTTGSRVSAVRWVIPFTIKFYYNHSLFN